MSVVITLIPTELLRQFRRQLFLFIVLSHGNTLPPISQIVKPSQEISELNLDAVATRREASYAGLTQNTTGTHETPYGTAREPLLDRGIPG